MATWGENTPHKVKIPHTRQECPCKVEMVMQDENAPHEVSMSMKGGNGHVG